MSNGVFLLVLIGLGFAFLIYFHQRSRNYQERHPGEDNPVDKWMTGEDDKNDTDGKDD